MTVTQDLKVYRQRLEGSGTPLLGVMSWFEVHETDVPWPDLESTMKAHGLDKFVPPRPKDANVFRRSTGNGDRKKLATPDPEITQKILMREVVCSGNHVIKQLVVETVDAKGVKLGHAPAVQLEFDPAHPTQVTVSSLPTASALLGETRDFVFAMAQEMVRKYQLKRDCVDAAAVRGVVRAVFADARSTCIRSGLYFVSNRMSDRIAALEAIAATIDGFDLGVAPIIDDKKQREQLRRAFEAETIDEIDKTINEVDALVHSGTKLTMEQYTTILSRFHGLRDKTGDYRDLLDNALQDTVLRLDIFETKIIGLLDQVQ